MTHSQTSEMAVDSPYGTRPRHLGLFEGIGGFSLAARWAGFESVHHVEIDPFRRRVLAKNFPGVPCHDDIRTYSATHLCGRIDLVTGGFPCQDISAAAGAHAVGIHGERSGLVTEGLRVVDECRPPWVVLENSPRLRLRGGDWLMGQFRARGYAVEGFLVEAADLGADHVRERAFVVAHLDEVGSAAPGEDRSGPFAVAQDPRRIGEAHRQGWANLVLRPGSVPSFRVRRDGQDVLEPALLRSMDGIPDGVDRVAALGDSLVPQQVYPLLQAIANEIKGNDPTRVKTVEAEVQK